VELAQADRNRHVNIQTRIGNIAMIAGPIEDDCITMEVVNWLTLLGGEVWSEEDRIPINLEINHPEIQRQLILIIEKRTVKIRQSELNEQ